jgi:hypothetical protein
MPGLLEALEKTTRSGMSAVELAAGPKPPSGRLLVALSTLFAVRLLDLARATDLAHATRLSGQPAQKITKTAATKAAATATARHLLCQHSHQGHHDRRHSALGAATEHSIEATGQPALRATPLHAATTLLATQHAADHVFKNAHRYLPK